MEEQLSAFFEELSNRQSKEPVVSDILYAALKASPALQSIVLDLMAHRDRSIFADFEREYPKEGYFLDLLFQPPKREPIILENKLFDRDYHYEKYSRLTFEGLKPQVFLLSAHQPTEELSGWKIIHWHDLVDKMEESQDDFLLPLAKYFRRVTMYKELELIDFAMLRVKGMMYLNRDLKEVIKRYGGKVRAEKYRAYCAENFSGYYYSITSSRDKVAWLWFGVVYHDKCEGVQLWLRKDWNPLLYLQISNALKTAYSAAEEDAEGLSVMMDTAEYNKFFECADKEEQLALLGKFFNELNRVVEKSIIGL